MVGAPASQLVDLMSAGLNKVDQLNPLYPHHHYISGLKGGVGNITGGTSFLRPLWGHCWPLVNFYAPDGTAQGTSSPLPHPSTSTSCQILQMSQLEGIWQNVHMWAV